MVENHDSSLRVLVVDHDRDSLRALGNMILHYGHKVNMAQFSRSALQMLCQIKETFDLAIIDVHLPDMDGFQFMEMISMKRGIPVILMSENIDSEMANKCVQNGAYDFLFKPLKMDEVEAKITRKFIKKSSASGKKNATHHTDGIRNLTIKEDDQSSPAARKTEVEEIHDSSEGSCSSKKQKIDMSKESHEKFINALNQFRTNGGVTNKILEIMSVPRGTRKKCCQPFEGIPRDL